MKIYYIAIIALAITCVSLPARADKPVFTQPQFTVEIECDNQVSVNDETGLAKVDCEPEDLKTYPFLADLTKEPTTKGSTYQFEIARIESKNLATPILLVNMHNEAIYSWWGSTGAYAVNANSTYTPQWTVNWGTSAYTAECPKKFSYIIKGNEKSTYGEWVYDGKNITRIAGYDKLEDFPSCQ
jgi:hypothetical protein